MVNLVFTSIFALEMVLKICALGIWSTPGAQPGNPPRGRQKASPQVPLFVFAQVMHATPRARAASVSAAGQSYLYDRWNWMDGSIATLSVLDVAAGEAVDLPWIKTLRLLRVLRPLRLVSRVPELKVVVEALIASVPAVGSILIVAVLFFVTFGILGVSLFSGKFNYCKGSDDAAMGLSCAPELFSSALIPDLCAAPPARRKRVVCGLLLPR